MYISDLKIHGFKSFAKKEDLRFGEGITAVVGPNGCGKTNIVDAIRWVLGEQKYSVLRSNKMEEIIFNGAKDIKPLGVCEVSLTVHNNKGKLPVEYNDIEISRRIYRNGESEYFMNRNPCRLKDIYDLFVDTGMGSDSYSVIELKMIEQILSESGNDRFRMFEEAAGINKYKNQRKLSLRKFELVKQDLERVDDIIKEVEEKVNHLNLQLKRFKRYEKLQTNLKDLEIDIAYLKLKNLENESSPLELKIQSVSQKRESKTAEEELNERELSHLQNLYKAQSKETEKMKIKMEKLKTELDSLNRNVLIWNEQSQAAKNQVERISSEKTINFNKVKKFNHDLKEAEEERKILAPEISDAVEKHKLKKCTFDDLNSDYGKILDTVELNKNNLWAAQKEKGDIDKNNHKAELLIEEKTQFLEELKIELSDLNSQLDSLDKKLTSGQKFVEEIKKKKIDSEKKISKCSDESQKLDIDFENVSRNIHENNGELVSLQSQKKFYESIITNNEGFPDGTSYIMKNLSHFSKIEGPVVDLLKVKKTNVLAVNAILGDLENCLVTDSRKSILKIIERLNDKNLGNVGFIPLDFIPNSNLKNKKIPQHPYILGRVSDFVECKKELNNLKAFLFDDCLLVKQLDSVDQKILSGWKCVDLNGNVSLNGMIKYQNLDESMIQLGRKDRLDDLICQISKLENHITSLTKKKNKIENQKNRISEKSSKENDDLDEINVLLLQAEGEMRQNIYQKEKNNERVIRKKSKSKELVDLIAQLELSREKTNLDLEKISKVINGISSNLDDSEKILTETRLKRDSLYEEVQGLHIDVLTLENKREQFKMKIDTAGKTIDELNLRDKEIDAELIELNQRILDLKEDIEANNKLVIESEGKISALKSTLDLKTEVKAKTFQDYENLQTLIRSEQKSRELLLEEIKDSEQKLLENVQRKNLITNRLKELFGVEIPDYLSVDFSEEELEQKIQKTHKSIENIGAVNMAVQSDYDDEMTRLELLGTQRSDLIKSEENLRDAIQEIDKIAREKFLNTFEQINANFSKLFTLFFEGGEGKLDLIGDPDPLESDIAIRAQPPGKRNQNLRMLSAGEKSLTAIALLFAIYQYKPSPYCILDEVDAPLDDVNIRKFTRVLKQFSGETQFIVVTHNKLTMEAANFLYGVTMEQKGVSKLVSVKFEA